MSETKRIRAEVTRWLDRTRNYWGSRELGPAELVEIEKDDRSGGFFLFYLDHKGEFLGDSWFQSLEEAKESAKIQFGIDDGDWQEVREPST